MAFRDILRALPPSLEDQVEGYLRFVEDISDELFREHNIQEPSSAQRETLRDVVAAWKVWRTVDSQYWLLQNALGLLEGSAVSEIVIGGSKYSRQSESFQRLATLRNGLLDVVSRYDARELTSASRLNRVVELAIEWTD